MFAFPLGLQAKTRDFPRASVIIAIISVVYSIFSFRQVDRFTDLATDDVAVMSRLSAEKSLAIAACAQAGFTREDCNQLKELARPGELETPRAFAARLTKKLPTDQARRLYAFAAETEPWMKAPAAVHALREYAIFSQSLTEENRALVKYANEQGLLTRSTWSLPALFRSLFLHEGWEHLLGNMAFFLLFAIPLESRIGALPLTLIYFIGGAFGMTAELFLSTEAAVPLLGASACVSAVAAAFGVAFWSFNFRLWVSAFFIVNRVVRMPAWFFLALFVVVQDLSGFITDMTGVSDHVAHFAHLSGFALGLMLGGIFTQLKVVPRPFHFLFELEIFLNSRAEPDFDQRLRMLREILFYNPGNTTALVESWNVIESLGPRPWSDLPSAAKLFLNEHYAHLLIHFGTADTKRANAFVTQIAANGWPASSWIPRQALGPVIEVVGELEKNAYRKAAAVLATALIEADPDSHRAQALRFLVNREALRTGNGEHESKTAAG